MANFGETTGDAQHDRQPGRAPVRLSVVSMLFASAVAILTWAHLNGLLSLTCFAERLQGANINHGLVVALLAGLGGSISTVVVRRWPRIVTVILLLEIAALGVAIVFVANDSATYLANVSCVSLLSDNYTASATSVSHVSYLYGLWGAPVVLLLWGTVAPWLKNLNAVKTRIQG